MKMIGDGKRPRALTTRLNEACMSLPHLTTSDRTARITSIYFHNATTLCRPFEVIQYSASMYCSFVIVLNVVFCL
jgi:hypothetical protein